VTADELDVVKRFAALPEAAAALLGELLAAELAKSGGRVATKHEVAVLDATAKADIYATADGRAAFTSIYDERDVCRAELARRDALARIEIEREETP
jgi:hypothetical protein